MTMNNTMHAVDSLSANEFAVELNGERVNGVFRISGLTTYTVDEQGRALKQPFTLSKMVQRDPNLAFNKWLRETMSIRHMTEKPTRELAVIAIDDGIETRRWIIKGAWLMAVRYSDFDSGSFEMVEEIFTINYEDIEESWAM